LSERMCFFSLLEMISKALPVPKNVQAPQTTAFQGKPGRTLYQKSVSGTTNRPFYTGRRVYHIKIHIVKKTFVI
jgi:hypothetical protein